MSQWAGRGAQIRSRGTTGRLLAEYQVRKLRRSKADLEFAECLRLAEPGSLAVDVGAYVGTFALGMAKSVGRSGLVMALEPQPKVYEQLLNATWASRVIPLNLAASEAAGWATFAVPVSERGMLAAQLGSLERRDLVGPTDSFDVRLARLDDLIGGTRRVSLLKIDVEGHERQVLAGAAEIIKAHKPSLVIEIEQRHLPVGSVADIVQPLISDGYECRFVGRGTILPWAEFDLERDQTQWLMPDGSFKSTTTGLQYGNNFIFTRRA